ncbi:MAG TPA: hypothetical protein VFB50_11280 [Chloroflexota bacterium]|nr:hypothetical protein [Chloroflexota bacterium]
MDLLTGQPAAQDDALKPSLVCRGVTPAVQERWFADAEGHGRQR